MGRLPLFVVAAGFAATIVSIASAQVNDQWMTYNSKWQEPGAIDSRGPGKGGFASVSEYYSTLNGRTMWLQDFVAGFGFTDTLSIWIGRQDYLLHGKSANTRFDLQDNEYGGKWVIKKPNESSDSSLAVEFAIVVPGTATGTTPTSTESFFATRNQSAAVDFGPGHDLETQLAIYGVKGAGTGYGNVYSFGLGKDFEFGAMQFRIQGQLFDDNESDAGGVHTGNKLRPVFYGAFGFDALKWLRLEADATLFTNGMPLAGNNFTGLSSFQVYNPGGAAADLRTDTVGIGAIRLLVHGSF